MSGNWFETREKELLGDAYETMYQAPPQVYRGLTVNGLRCTPQQFAQQVPAAYGLQPSPFCSQAFVLQGAPGPAEKLGHSPYHHAGVYYVQEPSAASAAGLLQVKPGDRVLDTCAAPGGKTSQLAAALQGEGVLVANEYVAARAGVLRSNLERMGVANALVLNEDTARLAQAFPAYFNKVLIDAPCSGEGMFRKETQAVAQHSEALVQQCAALGQQILDNAAACVAPGGLLAYSTCTFAPQEDEMQIGAFLQRHADFSLLPVPLAAGSPGEPARAGGFAYPVQYTRRIYPCHGGEGHFLALLQRAGSETLPVRKNMQGKTPPPECVRFLQQQFPLLAGRSALTVNDTVYLLPTVPLPSTEKPKLRVVLAGVQAGGIVKGRFVPAHHLYMAYGAQCTNCEHLADGDPRTAAWLRGEEISAHTAQPGYTAVLYNGFPLGYGKQSDGRIKNHYPKGLRNLK